MQVYDLITLRQKMKIKLAKGAKMPTRAHETDAGLDLYCLEDVDVSPCYHIEDEKSIEGSLYPVDPFLETVGSPSLISTGVHVKIPEGFYGRIAEKSGLALKGFKVGGGVIDESYTGELKVVLYNFNCYTHEFKAGDKVAQLIITPCSKPELELVDSLEDTDRGSGGFNSTGSR